MSVPARPSRRLPCWRGALDQPVEHRADAVGGFGDALLAQRGFVDDAGKAPVFDLQLQDLLKIGHQAPPGIGLGQGMLAQGRDLLQALLEQRVDDFFPSPLLAVRLGRIVDAVRPTRRGDGCRPRGSGRQRKMACPCQARAGSRQVRLGAGR